MLEGSEAFASLARCLKDGQKFEAELSDPPFERLRVALNSDDASSLDLAVLMRHALRYEALVRGHTVRFETNTVDAAVLEAAGLSIEKNQTGVSITAKPWMPDWLIETKMVSPDEVAMRAKRHRFHPDSFVPGDPFLRQFGLPGYRSIGQRSAVRAALGMPPGSMLLIDLPTGEGKSLVFRAIQKIGFANDLPGDRASLTIVVVPTVTLALDHERSCGGNAENPMAYVGGQIERNAKISENIRSGQQNLVFAAPEAIMGPLRYPIRQALEKDNLRAIVFDEAHLIEGWGTGFRTEFQTLAGLCHQWRKAPDGDRSFRIVFLSATLSKMARDTIQELFSPDHDLETVSAASIRPEPEFWVADISDPEERERRVLDALYHLPRPAILYVTKVKDAEAWYSRLTQREGYKRVKMVHGGTGSAERENVLSAWANGTLDIVVATSAFGLGIDYPHVRSVIHACVPEKLDRFYQEVGRGGRDGCSSISLLIPAHGDLDVAKGLSQQKIITVDRGFQRWKAMFESTSKRDLGDLVYGVRLDTAPSSSVEDIDLVGERSIDWNARVLSMMARSGLVRLTGVPDIEVELGEETPPYQGVQICNDGHLIKEVWSDLFEGRRQEIANANRASFQLLQEYMRGDRCPSQLIASLYPGCKTLCTQCRVCRFDPTKRLNTEIVGETKLPWPYEPKVSDAVMQELGAVSRLVIEYGPDLPKQIRARDMQTAFSRIDQAGFKIVVCVGNVPEWFMRPLEKAIEMRPWIKVSDTRWNRTPWPKGNSLIVVGPDIVVSAEQLNAKATHAEMIFIPYGQTDAGNPERKVSDMLTVPKMKIAEFFKRYLR
ncbi:protein DpdF [Rhodospirillales bacterium]|nr:protein DpdF [Rhodospirillales bacterium]